MNRFFYILFSILLISCGSSRKYKDSELEKILEERYGQEFIVEKNNFYFELNKFKFTAVLVKNPEIKVQGSYKDNNSEVQDNYPRKLNSYQAEQVLDKQLAPFYDNKFAVKANAMSVQQTGQTGEIPSFLELISSSKSEPIVYFHIYIFDTIRDNSKDILEGIVDAANFFNGNYYGTYTFIVFLWDSEFLNQEDRDKVKFGFNYIREDYADNIDARKEYLKQELVFEFEASENPEITMDRLLDLVMPYNSDNNAYNRLK